MTLLSVQGLSVQFQGERPAQALSELSFELAAGAAMALLGESGSGKSVTLRSLLRLHDPRRTRTAGRVVFDGQDIAALQGRALERWRGGSVGMVFQEPGLAFDPVCTVGAQIVETLRAQASISASEARRRALQLFDRVQIPQARRRLDAYPHELSGGLRQRAMIALALCCGPRLLLADEPTTALDATVQIQILLLLRELQRETGMALIFVTHDIAAAVEVADRIAVMYAGRIVEDGPVADIVSRPRHPYTAGLLASTVDAAQRGQPLATIPGSPPDLSALPPGCAFAARCNRAVTRCRAEQPPLARSEDGMRALACWQPVALP
jgi:peptide/nickel transport system ATP-binding protein